MSLRKPLPLLPSPHHPPRSSHILSPTAPIPLLHPPARAKSTPVKPLVSAVAHVLTLVGSLSGGGLAGGARALERHPALGSLLRALCIRIPDSSVRRSACSVLHRASAWQALGRDPSCCSGGAAAAAAAVGRMVAARNCGGGVVVASSTAKLGKDGAETRNNELARVLLASLRADLVRVQAVPFARSAGPGAAVRVGLSPVRRARGDATASVAAADGSGVGRSAPIVVPRLHLVEVTAFVAGLVHVMLENASLSSFPPPAVPPRQPRLAAGLPQQQELSTNRQSARHPQQQPQPPQLPARPSVLPADRDDTGTSKDAVGLVASVAAAAGGVSRGADTASVNGERDEGERERASTATEWLLEEAARRLAAHEFTETFE